jgi:hypothetical protein
MVSFTKVHQFKAVSRQRLVCSVSFHYKFITDFILDEVASELFCMLSIKVTVLYATNIAQVVEGIVKPVAMD